MGRFKRWRKHWTCDIPMAMNDKITRESAHPNGISYADGFRYLPDEFLCWMLLGAYLGISPIAFNVGLK